MSAVISRRSWIFPETAADQRHLTSTMLKLRHIRSAALLTGVLACTTLPQQPKTSLKEVVEPFAIRPGSSFAASGAAADINSRKPSKIAADILEAERIIRENYVNGKKVG